MQGFADQVVYYVRAVVLSGIDVVDAEFDRAAEHGARGVRIARRAKHAGTGELHRAEADAVDGLVSDEGCFVHADSLRAASRLDKRSEDPGCETTRLGTYWRPRCWSQ